MSRSGYSDDCDYLDLYRATVDRALRGKRGQAFLRELLSALDALPEKELIEGELINEQGKCCAIGAVCKKRNINVTGLDYTDQEQMGHLMGISRSMAAEIAYENDEASWNTETPAQRWERVRKWVVENLTQPASSP